MSDRREYERGYAAGRAKKCSNAERDRFDRCFAGAMTGLLSRTYPWGTGTGEKFKADATPDAYANTADQIAKAMMRKSL